MISAFPVGAVAPVEDRAHAESAGSVDRSAAPTPKPRTSRREQFVSVTEGGATDVPSLRDLVIRDPFERGVAQIAESRAVAARYQANETMPRPDAYGLRFKPVRLPTPENLLAVLDRDGYITAAIGVAKSLAQRDVAGVVESLGKLAPPNSAVRVTSRGLASALRGDIEGTLEAVVELSGNAELAGTVTRLRAFRRDAHQLVSRMPSP